MTIVEGSLVGYCMERIGFCAEPYRRGEDCAGEVFFRDGVFVCRSCGKQFQSIDEVSVDGIN